MPVKVTCLSSRLWDHVCLIGGLHSILCTKLGNPRLNLQIWMYMKAPPTTMVKCKGWEPGVVRNISSNRQPFLGPRPDLGKSKCFIAHLIDHSTNFIRAVLLSLRQSLDYPERSATSSIETHLEINCYM